MGAIVQWAEAQKRVVDARALLSQRSADQLRAWTTAGDIGPYLEKFQALGPLPDADLTETF